MAGFARLGRVVVGLWGFPLLLATLIGLTNGIASASDGTIAGLLLTLSSWAAYKSFTMGVRLSSSQVRYRGLIKTIVLPLDKIEHFDWADNADNHVDLLSDFLVNPVVYVRGRERPLALVACMFWGWSRGKKVDDLNEMLASARQ